MSKSLFVKFCKDDFNVLREFFVNEDKAYKILNGHFCNDVYPWELSRVTFFMLDNRKLVYVSLFLKGRDKEATFECEIRIYESKTSELEKSQPCWFRNKKSG